MNQSTIKEENFHNPLIGKFLNKKTLKSNPILEASQRPQKSLTKSSPPLKMGETQPHTHKQPFPDSGKITPIFYMNMSAPEKKFGASTPRRPPTNQAATVGAVCRAPRADTPQRGW